MGPATHGQSRERSETVADGLREAHRPAMRSRAHPNPAIRAEPRGIGSSGARDPLAREVKLLRRLQHPHIVPILDYGESEGFTYIVMPYIGTGTLQDRLQQGPLDVQTGARVTAQVASALSMAHDLGVIHRDVKPSNVLLDQEGNALLSDFSFAHQQDASQNLTGSALIGTPAYMSPEQCRGERIDSRSDQYSFGIMLYQLCTGKLPFEADTPMAVALMHVNTPLPRPRLANPKVGSG